MWKISHEVYPSVCLQYIHTYVCMYCRNMYIYILCNPYPHHFTEHNNLADVHQEEPTSIWRQRVKLIFHSIRSFLICMKSFLKMLEISSIVISLDPFHFQSTSEHKPINITLQKYVEASLYDSVETFPWT